MILTRRFRGPDRSGNGGYTGGLLAGALGTATTTVTLRKPPPLDTELDVQPDGDGVRLVHGDDVVATAAPGELSRPVPEPVAYEAALGAVASYGGFVTHPFAGCFTCGPDRKDGDGLRIFPGHVGDGVAAPWVPHANFAGEDGAVPAEIVWAALDCPGGWSFDLTGRPMVLGRMTATVGEVPAVGEECVVVGQAISMDGRKGQTASALYGADGRLLAQAEQVWIAVDPAVINALR